ncbi:MAG: phosphatidylserine decarboxylase family protein [Balneolaceae bacterium]
MPAREGYSTILVVFLIAAAGIWGASYATSTVAWTVTLCLAVLCGFILYFFRDPKRNPPAGDHLILSPADGTVVLIQDTKDPWLGDETVNQVSIFLSPLNVHVNRVPVSGKLEYLEYFPGKFLMAWEDHASEQNERAHFGVLHPSGIRLLFKQITGFMARRIVYHLRLGDDVTAGERFGIMKFGSRMDILIPKDIELRVSIGDRTVAGETILGEI